MPFRFQSIRPLVVFGVIPLLLIFSSLAASSTSPAFFGTGDPANPDFIRSFAEEVSGDGRTVLGRSTSGAQRAFGFDVETRTATLLPRGEPTDDVRFPYLLSANGLSFDGRIVAGNTPFVGRSFPGFIEDGQFNILSDPEPSAGYAAWGLTAVSGDGSVMVGTGFSTFNQGFIFDRSTGTYTLVPDPSGGRERSAAAGVSADGRFVVGLGDGIGSANTAFLIDRQQNNAFRVLPGFVGGAGPLTQPAISADGSTIVGAANAGQGNVAARHDRATGITLPLDTAADTQRFSIARAASGDGSVIVGYTGVAFAPDQSAFVWTEASGLTAVADLLATLGLSDALAGWTLTEARDISDDGTVIVGYGTNPDGRDEGWVAVIPEPTALGLLFALTCFTRLRGKDSSHGG
ncbi:MAG: hypothetical protein AAGF84_12095 [Planctomycetota bacterium]